VAACENQAEREDGARERGEELPADRQRQDADRIADLLDERERSVDAVAVGLREHGRQLVERPEDRREDGTEDAQRRVGAEDGRPIGRERVEDRDHEIHRQEDAESGREHEEGKRQREVPLGDVERVGAGERPTDVVGEHPEPRGRENPERRQQGRRRPEERRGEPGQRRGDDR
jgi:hypothetical protein